MFSIQEREKQLEALLAPHATRSSRSRGRKYPEPQHPYRSEFQRDRDRILHCRSFRRLEYKTQVFVNGMADHYRTRLTHTMEMAAAGRTIARALGANEDLTEAIALAHDVGHSPFGHCGEAALNDLMKDHGGFDHNLQGLRAIEIIEQRYPGFPGLNLTWEVRAGLLKHQAAIQGAQLDGHPIGPFQSLEAQIADVADDLTYLAHDVDDGFDAGLLTEELMAPLGLWQKALARAHLDARDIPADRQVGFMVRCLLDVQVEDVIRHSGQLLARHQPASPAAVMNAPERLVDYTPEMKALAETFKAFLFQTVYFSPTVSGANREAVEMMRKLFLFYVAHPETMGRKARTRLPVEGLWRTVCDYIAGMTDRYALEEYRKFVLGN